VKKIGIYARDPGSANIATSIYDALIDKGYKVILLCKDYAYTMCIDKRLPCINVTDYMNKVDIETVKKYLLFLDIDVIITGTSLEDNLERAIWKASCEINIKTYAILDQWMNLIERFENQPQNIKSRVFPDIIMVMDQMVYDILVNEGVESNHLRIVGQPYFEQLALKYTKKLDLLNHPIRLNQNNTIKILFLSQPIDMFYNHTLGYTEYSVFSDFISMLENIRGRIDKDLEIALRLHPKENKEKFLDKVSLKYNTKIYFDEEINIEESIMKSDIVVGMFSTGLFEATLIGKPILSIQVGLNDLKEDKFFLKNLANNQPVYKLEDLEIRLLKLLTEPQIFEIDSFIGSSEKIISVLEETFYEISD